MQNRPKSYTFGPFSLDSANHLLLRDGEPIHLTPKAFDLLSALVANHGRVLTKDSLLSQIWPDACVEESALSKSIFVLRKALGDSEEQSFIETVPKVGYRFVAEVREAVPEEEAGRAPEPHQVAEVRPPLPALPARSARRVGVTAAVALLVVAALAGLGFAMWRQSPAPPEQHPPRRALLVLPFKNLGGDQSQDYFADGLTEELITQLGQMQPRELGVIGRTSAMQYRNTRKPWQQVGRELGVGYVLDGSVQRQGERVRINVQLIELQNLTELWGETYDRAASDVLGIEAGVARAVARQIRIKLSPGSDARLEALRKVSTPAYEDYLRGRYLWNKRTEDSLRRAAAYFERATAEDPNFAPAYAGLADCYALLNLYSSTTARASFPLAKQAAQKALSLDDGSAEAHTSLGYILLWYDWNWPGAEREYLRALEINPAYATAHQYYAEYLRLSGRQREAIEEDKKALQIDPLSAIVQEELALPYYCLGDNDAALKQLHKLLDVEPNFNAAHAHLGWVYEQSGRYDDAINEYKIATREGAVPWMMGALGQAYAEAGQQAKARAILQELKTKYKTSDKFAVALVYEGLGERNQALEWLERGLPERNWGLLTLRVDPKWKDYRNDARFQAILRHFGTPDAAAPGS